MERNIDDFGKKIGGAKKDLAKAKTITHELLLDMNERELLAFVKKDKIIQKYDYKAMIEDGIPPAVALYIKKCRDVIPVQPFAHLNVPFIDVCQKYVECVKEFDEVLRAVRSEQDALNLFQSLLVDRGYIEKSQKYTGYSYYFSDKARTSCFDSKKLFSTFQLNSLSYSRLVREAEKLKFGSAEKSEAKKPYGLYFNSYKNLYFVTKGRYVISEGYASKEEASSVMDSYNSKSIPSSKIKLVEPTLTSVERSGIDVRNRAHVVGQDFLDVFMFSGGEFGNWLNLDDRQYALNFGFDAFIDLANTLNINPTSISFNGNLSIAFGSRGVPNAKAHYEPLRQVINLTKMHGAGSLAHEWFHALDDFLSRRATSNSTELLSNLPYDYILESTLPKEVTNSFFDLLKCLNRKQMIVNGKTFNTITDYKQNAIYLDNHVSGKNGHSYWQSNPELLARAFSCYLQDKMNFRSDYLESGHSNDYFVSLYGDKIKPFIEGEERVTANKAFDSFFDVLKRHNLLSTGMDLNSIVLRFEQNKLNSDVIGMSLDSTADIGGIDQFTLDL